MKRKQVLLIKRYQFGRLIQLRKAEMPGLMVLRLLVRMRIHMTIQTAVLLETLVALGAG